MLQLDECLLLYLFAPRWYGGFCRMASAHVSNHVTSAECSCVVWYGRCAPTALHSGLAGSWVATVGPPRVAQGKATGWQLPVAESFAESVASSPILGLAKPALSQGSHGKESARIRLTTFFSENLHGHPHILCGDSRNRMVLPEAFLGEATRSVPTGSPWGNSKVPTHNTDVRIVLTLVGGGEAKFYGNAAVAGRSLAEYEHHAALLRGPNEALPRQDQTAAAPTVSMERRDRRKKKLAKAEAEQVETREAQAA